MPIIHKAMFYDCGYGGGPLQGAYLGAILLPVVTRFALTPGCTLSPIQGDKYAISSFLTLHYISTLAEQCL